MVTWPVRTARISSAVPEPLLTRAQRGDRDALRALLTPHEASLLRLCLSQTGNIADAEDAVQETLLLAIRALTRPGGFRGDATLKTWLVRIALNVCRSRRRRWIPAPQVAEAAVAGPEEATIRRLALEEALRRLTPGQRAALTLQAIEGWSVREIAAALKTSEKRVENDLYRARKALVAWENEHEDGV